MPKKNDKVILTIIDMTNEGLGVAKEGLFVYFVKDAIIGDKVEANITKITDKIIYAKMVNIIEASKYREKAKCSVCDACGGCQIMPLSYDKQLELKENNVKNNLKRIGLLDDVTFDRVYEGIIGMDIPYHYRNKVQMPFLYKDGEVKSGFYASRTHHIVENEGCIVSFEAAYKIIDEVKKYLKESDAITIYNEMSGYGVLRELMIRQGNKTHEISVTFIANDKKKNIEKYKPLVDKIIKVNNNIKTVTLNINTNKNNVLFGNENILLYGNGYIEDEICGFRFQVSPESFYQVNNVQTEKLYMTMLDFVKEKKIENALDMYCGIGTTTIILSKIAKKITGLEIVKKAVDNANTNLKINNVNNVRFVCADANLVDKYLNEKYDMISVDPPRKGLDTSTIDFIKKQLADVLLYTSCDSATLARDIKILSDTYKVERIKCVDMFPHTMHVECVVLLLKHS